MRGVTYDLLFHALTAESGPPDDIADAVLAAADGPDALDAHLDGGGPLDRRTPTAAPAAVDPARVYLTEIAVEGFRGVGPRARLPLEPGPGLTVVVGRNGSGKSSFAEGLELLLTGSNLRWEKKPATWKDGWRNLHGTRPTTLEATFSVDGEPTPLKVAQTWPPGTALTAPDPTTVTGPRADWDALGWDAALQRYRPLLSYSELGTMFSERAKELFDALSSILGVEAFDALQERLRKARLARSDSAKREKQARDALKAALAATGDERATIAKAQVARQRPDAAAVAASLVDPEEDADLAALRALATLAVPDAGRIADALRRAATAADELTRLQQTDADRDHQVAELVDAAVAFHTSHDDPTCPVCKTPDVLDTSWAIRAQAELAELRAHTANLRAARTDAQAATNAVDALFDRATPHALRQATFDTRPAQEAWDVWREAPADPDRANALQTALDTVRAQADALLAERDLAWRPLHEQITTWVGLALEAGRHKAIIATITAAEAWVKAFTADLRAERLAPVVTAAQTNWDRLRHESNVTLGEVELRKSGNVKQAVFDVTVDGTAASAFGVMSQGELSALAISVFLPRASLPESPFGFLVIDDPVQAMDPAKVDGLARVFEAAAQTRQVVVFTHDDRLPQAIDRLSIDARVINVQRRAQSQVDVVPGARPSRRYIAEAFALCKTNDLPDAVRRRVVPVFCRSAIEAACDTVIRRREHRAGTSHADIEALLAGLTSTNLWLAEAFGLGKAQGNETYDKVRAIGGNPAVEVVKAAKAGAHASLAADLLQLTRGAEKLVLQLEAE